MTRTMMGRGLALWMLLAVALTPACGDDPPPAGTQQDPPVNNDDGPPNNANPNNEPMMMARLEHASAQTANMAANSRVDLKVRYIDAAGSPQANQTIGWEIVGQPEGASVDALQSITDSAGEATVQVLSAAREASFQIEASVVTDAGVTPIRFTVNVQSKEFASYRIQVNYDGARRYTNNNIKVSLYETPGDCAEFNPLQPGTALRSEKRRPDAQGVPMNFTFGNLQNGTQYTAVAVAFAAESDTVEVIGSFGCNDERPLIADGENPPVLEINMDDVLPQVAGTWAVTSRFNLTEALPEDVLNVLNPILDFFGDPAGTLVTLLLDVLQDQFGFDAGSVQNVLQGIAEDLLESVFDGNDTVRDILTGGADVAEIIRNFHLEGSIIIPAEAVAANGLVTGARLNYTNFGYRWRLNCESDEEFEENPACGDAFIPFGDAGLTPIEANWDGSVTPNLNFDPNTGRVWFHELSINDHNLDLNYGQIIAYLIEKVALPLLFDPTIDSLNALLVRFIDCQDIFDNNTLQTICGTAIDEVSNLLRSQLAGLSLNSNDFTVGTFPEQPCALYEQEDDEYGAPEPPNQSHTPKFKEMGKDIDHPDHGSLRCLWNAQIQSGDNPDDIIDFSGEWFGTKRFD